MPYALRPLLLLLLTLVAVPSLAETRWYKVEVVIFAHNDATALNEEYWSSEVSPPPLAGAVEMRNANEGGRTPFTLLPESQMGLNGVVKRLEESPATQPLLHFAWYQPGLPRNRAVTVHVHDDMGKVRVTAPLTPLLGYQLPVWQDDTLPERLSTIEGTLRLSLARYLHLDSDLVYTKSFTRTITPAPAPAGSPQTAAALPQQITSSYRFRLHESRRMRSKDLHYIDHPMFGMLVKVTPLQ